MKNLLRIIFVLVLAGCSPASVDISSKPIIDFPSEEQVNAFLKIGLDKESVVQKFGEPPIKTPQPAGSSVDEIYYYFKPPPSKPYVAQHYAYDGFQVSFVKGKVTDFSIIHRSVLLPPPAVNSSSK